MHAHSTSATNPRNHHFSLHQKFKINRPFHPLFLWQLSIKFVTHRHEENTCMRMNLPNPRFFFPPFIHSSWVTCLDYSMTHLLIILPFLLSVQSCQSCIDCFTLSASEQIYLDGDLMRSRHLFLWPWELSIWAHPALDFQHECWSGLYY